MSENQSSNSAKASTKKISFKEALLNKRMLICLFNGFTSGLPLYYIYQLVPAWLRSDGIDLKTIGLFSLVTLPYSLKIFWAPLLDRISLPFLGRRRGWMLVSQIGCMMAMASLSLFNPVQALTAVVVAVAAMCIFSATQDVVLDAYRRELLPDSELGLGNSFYQNAYRVAGFVPGGLGIILADYVPWSTVHLVIALFMLVGIIHTFSIKEIVTKIAPPKNMVDAYIEPFLEFFKRDGVSRALLILAFMFFYKLGDTMATALATPFYIDMGFSLTQIGSLIKLTNFWSMFIGSIVGGLYIYRYGINRSLWIFGFMQWVTIFGFVILSLVGNNVPVLIVVLTLEYLAAGLGTSAFMAYIARVSSVNFTGTQLAMFSSLFGLARSLASGSTGFLIEGISAGDGIFYKIFGQFNGLGWTKFFILSGVIAIPGMILLFWVAPWNGDKVKHENSK
ncbi:MAG: AmpG family muropeptide MFS transporter [Bdellovibrionales bacterium]|nr:AmpG family muropeptide MFS transporter [Bdellovibrionales bacterium]